VKPFSIIVPFLFVAVVLAGYLPRLSRLKTATVEMLPSTSLLPGIDLAPEKQADTIHFPGLDSFSATVVNGQSGAVVGIYVPGTFALPVVQQPKDQPAFVSGENGVLTQFALPHQYGTTGLLAHNYLSGSFFSTLVNDQDVVVVYGDGRREVYRVERIERFQALTPNSPYSDFVSLSDSSSKVLTSAALFNYVYTNPNKLVFQTCIDAYGDPSWGRLFITATRVETLQPVPPASGQFIHNN
jgi:hypothetical protein